MNREFTKQRLLSLSPFCFTNEEIHSRLTAATGGPSTNSELVERLYKGHCANKEFLINCGGDLLFMLPEVGPDNEEINAWCVENTKGKWGKFHDVRYWWFEDPADAIAFKMTWC